uniref:Uncharacterized protein n=1 Tax=viral metagenome TaxID=1070528 RepID=A0A6C0M455_9ZZZZ
MTPGNSLLLVPIVTSIFLPHVNLGALILLLFAALYSIVSGSDQFRLQNLLTLTTADNECDREAILRMYQYVGLRSIP